MQSQMCLGREFQREGAAMAKALSSEEKGFELDPLWVREPVEVLEDRGDVVTGAGEGEQASSRVLDIL